MGLVKLKLSRHSHRDSLAVAISRYASNNSMPTRCLGQRVWWKSEVMSERAAIPAKAKFGRRPDAVPEPRLNLF